MFSLQSKDQGLRDELRGRLAESNPTGGHWLLPILYAALVVAFERRVSENRKRHTWDLNGAAKCPRQQRECVSIHTLKASVDLGPLMGEDAFGLRTRRG